MKVTLIDHAWLDYFERRMAYAKFLRSHGWILTAGNHAIPSDKYAEYDHEMNRAPDMQEAFQ